MENAKIRNELNTLRKAVADSTDLEGTGVKGTAARKFMGKKQLIYSQSVLV